MIEDLQDELINETPQEEVKSPTMGRFLFLAFLIWIVYSAVIIIFSLPKMISSVREADLKILYADYVLERSSAQYRDAKVCYVIPKSDGTSSYVLVNQKVPKTGSTQYHDVIEALLSGTSHEALSSGAISYIQSGTTLIGLTVSSGTAFVNLSSSFTGSGSSWGPEGLDVACGQITRTLQAADSSIRKVIILVNGDELSI